MQEVDELIGCTAAKQFFRDKALEVQYIEQGGNMELRKSGVGSIFCL